MTIEDLIRYESITQKSSFFLEKLVKANTIFLYGGTGRENFIFKHFHHLFPKMKELLQLRIRPSCNYIPKNIARMETRNANTEGKIEIGINALIKHHCMRPERAVGGSWQGGIRYATGNEYRT